MDNLAHRYRCLPSEALTRANTLDLYVLDISTKWARHQQEVADGRTPAKPIPKLSVEEMQNMIAQVRGEIK